VRSQELDSESVAFVGAFDEAGDVGHDQALVAPHLGYPEARVASGEGVVSDLRPGA